MNSVSYDFTGTKVLITGGSSGIGHATARRFAAAGASVVVTGTRPSAADYDTDLEGLEYHRCQLSDPASVDALLEVLGPLDVLVNNAGANLAARGGRGEWSPDVYADSLRMNLLSPMQLTMGCQERLRVSTLPGGASVVNTLSMAGHRAAPSVPGYGSSKMGMLALTMNLAHEWAADGIRVNAISPGLIVTPMTAGLERSPEHYEKELRHTPLGRFGTADECAGVILWLCSAGARYITGTSIAVDGGYLTY